MCPSVGSDAPSFPLPLEPPSSSRHCFVIWCASCDTASALPLTAIVCLLGPTPQVAAMRDKAREHAVHISRADYEAGRDTIGGIEAGLLNGGAVAGGGAGGDGEGDEGEDDGNVPSKSPQKVHQLTAAVLILSYLSHCGRSLPCGWWGGVRWGLTRRGPSRCCGRWRRPSR